MFDHLYADDYKNFLSGKRADHRGRMVAEYLEMSEEEMELDHEWIQWAFAIDTISVHNPHAPIIQVGDLTDSFTVGQGATYYKLLNKYLASIGFDTDFPYDENSSLDEKKYIEVVGLHNMHHIKRISRVMHSLMLTGNDDYASEILNNLMFFDACNEGLIPADSLQYWIDVIYSDEEESNEN